MSSDRLSQRGYAAHRRELGLSGGTLSAVQKAIEEERIDYDPEEGIDPALADSQWEQRTTRRGNGESSGASADYLRARTVEKIYQSRKAKLEYELLAGTLVYRAVVARAEYAVARLVRDRILAVADRVSAELASMRSAPKLRARLREELALALSELASMEKGGVG